MVIIILSYLDSIKIALFLICLDCPNKRRNIKKRKRSLNLIISSFFSFDSNLKLIEPN